MDAVGGGEVVNSVESRSWESEVLIGVGAAASDEEDEVCRVHWLIHVLDDVLIAELCGRRGSLVNIIAHICRVDSFLSIERLFFKLETSPFSPKSKIRIPSGLAWPCLTLRRD